MGKSYKKVPILKCGKNGKNSYKEFEKKQSNKKIRHYHNLVNGKFYKKVHRKVFFDIYYYPIDLFLKKYHSEKDINKVLEYEWRKTYINK